MFFKKEKKRKEIVNQNLHRWGTKIFKLVVQFSTNTPTTQD